MGSVLVTVLVPTLGLQFHRLFLEVSRTSALQGAGFRVHGPLRVQVPNNGVLRALVLQVVMQVWGVALRA